MIKRTKPKPPPVRVNLTCCYCKGDSPREELAYCEACLAPYHAECFTEHGQCAIHGCGGEHTIGRSSTPRETTRGAGFWSASNLRERAIYGLVVLLVGIVAWCASSFTASYELDARRKQWTAAEAQLQSQLRDLSYQRRAADYLADDYRVNLEALTEQGARPFNTRKMIFVSSIKLEAVLVNEQPKRAVFAHQGPGRVAVEEGGFVVVGAGTTGQQRLQVKAIGPNYVTLNPEGPAKSKTLWLGRPQHAKAQKPSFTQQQVDSDKQAYWEVMSNRDDYRVERGADGQVRYVRTW